MTSIHVVDFGDFYQLYGVITLIITILLLWYFVRSNISVKRCNEGLEDAVHRTYNTVLQDGRVVVNNKVNLGSIHDTNANDRYDQNEQIRYIHALSSYEPTHAHCKLRGLSDMDITNVVDADNANAQREGLNNPSGTPDNDFGELALPFATTRYPVTNVELTEKNKDKPYNMQIGIYGGVPVTFYNAEDMLYSPEWYHGVGSGLYVQNSRSLFKKVNWPIQKAFW